MASKKRPNEDVEGILIDLDEPVFTTGVVCRLLEMPVWVLKQLDREEIVSPPRKKEGQARLYSQRELKVVKRCWYYMSEHGVKVNGLRIILKLEER